MSVLLLIPKLPSYHVMVPWQRYGFVFGKSSCENTLIQKYLLCYNKNQLHAEAEAELAVVMV